MSKAGLYCPRPCPCLAERMEAGTVGYARRSRSCFAPSAPDRKNHAAGGGFPGTMWQDDAHKERMTLGCCWLPQGARYAGVLRRAVSADSNKELDRTFNCFFRGGIDFRYARRRGISPTTTLPMAAKSPIFTATRRRSRRGDLCGAADHPGRGVPAAHQRPAHRPFWAGRPENY